MTALVASMHASEFGLEYPRLSKRYHLDAIALPRLPFHELGCLRVKRSARHHDVALAGSAIEARQIQRVIVEHVLPVHPLPHGRHRT